MAAWVCLASSYVIIRHGHMTTGFSLSTARQPSGRVTSLTGTRSDVMLLWRHRNCADAYCELINIIKLVSSEWRHLCICFSSNIYFHKLILKSFYSFNFKLNITGESRAGVSQCWPAHWWCWTVIARPL